MSLSDPDNLRFNTETSCVEWDVLLGESGGQWYWARRGGLPHGPFPDRETAMEDSTELVREALASIGLLRDGPGLPPESMPKGEDDASR